MSATLTPPPFAIAPSPVAIDEVIASMQYALQDLPWLENSLGRVYPQTVNGKLEPWIYKEDGEHYRAYPNDKLDNFSCIYTHDDEQPDDTIYRTRTISVIVWVNLKALGYLAPTIEPLKQDVWRILRDLYNVTSVDRFVDQTNTGTGAIYPGFDLSGLAETYNSYPFGAFRIECTTKYADLCYY